MLSRLDPIDQALLDRFQRDFPLVPRPFTVLAETLGLSEALVIERLERLRAEGRITRVGATVRPNTAGASTLAAMAVPEDRIETVAGIVNQEVGVNHSYLREHRWNLWFVATAPDGEALERSLGRLRVATGLDILDLRLERPFNIDLGFSLRADRRALPPRREPDLSVLRPADRPILHALSQGLSLVAHPFAALAKTLGRGEDDVLGRIRVLAEAGILTRVGVIVRHRAIGWTSNAMVVWAVPEDRIGAAGEALATHPGMTLCYQRRTVPGLWEYPLFSMIHARSRPEALSILDGAARLPALRGVRYEALFSLRCFRQSGARIHDGRERAA
jgi:DNA-binding Lrp family transcriptional regulator